MGPTAIDPEPPNESIKDQLRELSRIILDPHARRSLALLAGAIVAVIAFNTVFQVRLNNWQGNIYNAIGQRDIPIFFHETWVFLIIVGVLLALAVAQTWLQEILKVRLRQAVTFDLLHTWLQPHRIFQLKQSGDISANPDQRIQDDARRLSELSADLGVGLIQSSFLLIAFIGVLWQLSAQVKFMINGSPVTIPGYMVWAALAYSAMGWTFTWLVGKPLIRAHSELRAKEADFRFALVRVSESADEIALAGGEDRERLLLAAPLRTLLATMRRIANRLAALTWVTGGYGWLAILAPLLLAAPGYFGGTLTLGGLMMVVGAFYQVQSALRWFVDKFPVIAEWRAMLSRVISYRSALERLPGRQPGRIRYETGAAGISIENLSVSWNGGTALKVPNFKIAPGERVLIEATPKSGKSTLHKVLAGLWDLGSGTVRMPAREKTLFLPQTPYFPMGSLRDALTYPDPPACFSDGDVISALDSVRLGRLAADLDTVKRWDKDLTLDERRRLVIGRVLLHRPQWLIQDESMYELDEESRQVALSLFALELAHTAVLSIGRHHLEGTFYQRVLKLQAESRAARL